MFHRCRAKRKAANSMHECAAVRFKQTHDKRCAAKERARLRCAVATVLIAFVSWSLDQCRWSLIHSPHSRVIPQPQTHSTSTKLRSPISFLRRAHPYQPCPLCRPRKDYEDHRAAPSKALHVVPCPILPPSSKSSHTKTATVVLRAMR